MNFADFGIELDMNEVIAFVEEQLDMLGLENENLFDLVITITDESDITEFVDCNQIVLSSLGQTSEYEWNVDLMWGLFQFIHFFDVRYEDDTDDAQRGEDGVRFARNVARRTSLIKQVERPTSLFSRLTGMYER